jgi:hypothetical protein
VHSVIVRYLLEVACIKRFAHKLTPVVANGFRPRLREALRSGKTNRRGACCESADACVSHNHTREFKSASKSGGVSMQQVERTTGRQVTRRRDTALRKKTPNQAHTFAAPARLVIRLATCSANDRCGTLAFLMLVSDMSNSDVIVWEASFPSSTKPHWISNWS